ncbi:TPA: hypothetical protein ACSTJD_005274, partial [Serratia fonticola]
KPNHNAVLAPSPFWERVGVSRSSDRWLTIDYPDGVTARLQKPNHNAVLAPSPFWERVGVREQRSLADY